MKHRKSCGNLHVYPKGDFDGGSAWELVNLIHQQYSGQGRVFVNTDQIGRIHWFGRDILRNRLDKKQVPMHQVYFKGQKGFELAPSGARVIVTRRHSGCACNGNCTNCACKAKKGVPAEEVKA
jgi:hypothetical protein